MPKVKPSTTCRCLRSGSPRIRRNAPRAGSFAPGQSSANIGPELIPHVPDEPAEESVADPAHVLRRGRRARRKPGVRNEVAADRPCITRPRRSHATAPATGNEHCFRRVSGSRPNAGAARGKIPRVFAPCRAQPGLDRILKSSFAIRASRTVCRTPTSSRPTRMEYSMRYSRRRGRHRWRCWWHRTFRQRPTSIARLQWVERRQKIAQPCRLVPSAASPSGRTSA